MGTRKLFIVEASRPGAPHVTFTALRDIDRARRLREAASDVGPAAQLVVDSEGIVVHLNRGLRRLFGLTRQAIGRPLQELELSFRPFELRPCVERAYLEGHPTAEVDGRWTGPDGEVCFLELSVVPLLDGAGSPLGASIQFIDVSRQRRLEEHIHRASRELEAALAEVRSTNEELETISEELRALNERARDRGDPLGDLDIMLESILSSLRSALAVVDRDLRVRRWSRGAEQLWGPTSAAVLRKNFLNLDIGLPVDRLLAPIGACLAGRTEVPDVMLGATDRHGRGFQVRVTCTPLGTGSSAPAPGVILLMEAANGRD